MSNPISLQATKFTNLPSQEETFGFRMYDNYGTTYVNTMDEVPTEDLILLDIVLRDYSGGEEIGDMLSSVHEMETGMNINGNWYDYHEIESFFHKHYN